MSKTEDKKIVVIPSEVIERIAESVVKAIDSIDWSKAPELYLKAERPRGEWIKEEKPFGGFGDCVLVNTCSICGESFIYHGENANFCSCCGADMRGGEANDN